MDNKRLLQLAGVVTDSNQLNEGSVEQEQLNHAANRISTHITSSIVDWMKDDPEAIESMQENPEEILALDVDQHLEEIRDQIANNVVKEVTQKLGSGNNQ